MQDELEMRDRARELERLPAVFAENSALQLAQSAQCFLNRSKVANEENVVVAQDMLQVLDDTSSMLGAMRSKLQGNMAHQQEWHKHMTAYDTFLEANMLQRDRDVRHEVYKNRTLIKDLEQSADEMWRQRALPQVGLQNAVECGQSL